MKKVTRILIKDLAEMIFAQLCAFCKFSEWAGCCDGSYCIHPLNEKFKLTNETNEPFPGEALYQK